MAVRCCEVRIENSVTRVTVRHREWCRTVILTDGIFNSHRTTIMDSFSCILFLRQLHLSLSMYFLINFMQKYNYIQSRNVWFGSYLRCWRWNVWRKMTLKWHQTCKLTSQRHNRRPDIIHESRHTPPRVRRHFLAPVGFMEIQVGYARIDLSALVKIAQNIFLHTSFLMKDSYILTYQCLQDGVIPVFTYNIIAVGKIDPTSLPIPHRCLGGISVAIFGISYT